MRRGAQRVIIVGGGFGGIYTALALQAAMQRRRDLEVLLFNRTNYFLYDPLLPEVLSGGVEPRHVVVPLRTLFDRVRVLEAEVQAVDPTRREVVATHGGMQETMTYEHLVIATGGESKVPAALSPVVFPFKTAEDAIALHNQVVECFEAAEFTADALARRALLTFVVVGGGATGVEALGELEAYVHGILRYYPRLSRNELRLVLIDLAPHILAEVGLDLGEWAAKTMTRRGLELHLRVTIERATPDGVALSDGTWIPARTVIWTIGTAPGALLRELPFPKTPQGWLVGSADLSVPGFAGVWALGDAAKIPAANGTSYPPTAQHAVGEARVLAGNILAALDGRPTRPYRHPTLATFVSIGGQQGVAMVRGRSVRGVAAWMLWRAVHFMLLPKAERKWRVLFDWLLSSRTRKDIVQLGLRRTPSEPSAGPQVAFWRHEVTSARPAEKRPGS